MSTTIRRQYAPPPVACLTLIFSHSSWLDSPACTLQLMARLAHNDTVNWAVNLSMLARTTYYKRQGEPDFSTVLVTQALSQNLGLLWFQTAQLCMMHDAPIVQGTNLLSSVSRICTRGSQPTAVSFRLHSHPVRFKGAVEKGVPYGRRIVQH